MSYNAPSPERHIPSAKPQDILQPGDPLGSFVGYLRRPKSLSAGLLAQFFGENGTDADVITALHLTKFLDTHVKVTVWMMKDRYGKIMKKNGEYQKLTEFIATVKRPQPSNHGQTALFFGENGSNADAINILNQSNFLDALVYVEMHQAVPGMSVHDVPNATPQQDIEQHAHRMTPTEAGEFKKLQKRSEQALQVLTLSGFFRQDTVLSVLGRETEYDAWLESQVCCHPGNKPCDKHPVHAWKIPGGRRYTSLPLCFEHKEMWETGVVEMNDGSTMETFSRTQSITYLQRWATQALSKTLRVPQGSIPTPNAIMTWATQHKLASFIPNTFKTFLAG